MPRSASIEMRLRNVSAINACLLIVAGLVGSLSLRVADATVQDVVSRLDPLAETNRQVLQSLTDAETGMRGYVVTGDPLFLEPFWSGSADFGRELARARALAGDDDHLVTQVDEQDRTGHRWLDEVARPVIGLRPTDAGAAEQLLATGTGKQLFDDFRAANGAAQATVAVLQQRAADHVRAETTLMTALGVIVTLAAAGAGLALARRAATQVGRPLLELDAALHRITGGDLRTRVAVTGPAEVADVAGALNTMAAEMERLTALERDRVGQERLIREVSRAFRMHLDEDELLATATAGIAAALAADRAEVWDVANGSGGLRASWSRTHEAVRAREQPPADLLELVSASFESAGLLRIDDVERDPTVSDEARRFLRTLGVRSLLLCPLVAFDDTAAVLRLDRGASGLPWTDADVSVARAVARELGVAVEHARLFRQQRDAVDELHRLDEAKAAFVSSVSHELRTPLTSIVGYTELLLDGDAGELPPAQREMTNVVDRNARRLLALIDDLLLLSRIDAGALQRSRARVGPGEVVEAAVGAVRPLLANRELLLRVEAEPDLPDVWADESELERALINLLSNAIKFTPDGGSVWVSAAAVDGEVVMEVTDTGAGIPAEELPMLFARFFRSSRARTAQVPGTGLGLAIVKGIVDDHGGTLDVRSTVDVGTTFTIRLPALDPPAEPEATGGVAAASGRAPGEEH